MNLPYDPEHPPQEPPPGCDRLLWMIAYQVHVDHQPGPDGRCGARTCRIGSFVWPCHAAGLAGRGFLGAVGAWAGLDNGRPASRWTSNVPRHWLPGGAT